MPTYGSLIKACNVVHRFDHCWVYWRERLEGRGMEPSEIVLGCMLDALVSNDSLETAAELMDEWKCRVNPKTKMYFIIIKGFAATHQSSQAMAMWREIREREIPMITVAYNALIDAQARVGAMDEVKILVTSIQPEWWKKRRHHFLLNCEGVLRTRRAQQSPRGSLGLPFYSSSF